MNWRAVIRSVGLLLGVLLILRTVFDLGRTVGHKQAVHQNFQPTAKQDKPHSGLNEPIEITFEDN